MARVGEQSQAVGQEAADDLDEREADGEREDGRERAARALAVIVPVVVVTGAAVDAGSRRQDRRVLESAVRARAAARRRRSLRCQSGQHDVRRVAYDCAWQRSSSSSPVASAARRAAAGSDAAPDAVHSARSWRSSTAGTGSRSRAPRRAPERLGDVRVEEAARVATGVPELDRVLGGGLVPASLVLLGGEPGVGKSTLLLSALGAVARSGRQALLVTGEESVAQVRLRAERLGGADDVSILAETELEAVCATLERETPAVCVIDSVQTLYASELGSAPGSVAQVREAAARLLRVAKEKRRRDRPRRSRHEGRRGRGAARARAPRRLRAPVRGRPVPRPPDPARGQEPLRLDERARRVRDDREPGSSAFPTRRALFGRTRGRRGRAQPSRSRSRGRGRSCSRSRRSSRAPTSRCRAGSAPGSIPSVSR